MQLLDDFFVADEVHQNVQGSPPKLSSSAGSTNSQEKDSDSMYECEVHWDDLRLGEEIGQGNFSVSVFIV